MKWYLPLKNHFLVMISSLFEIVHLPLVQEKFKTFPKKCWLHTSLKILIDLRILLIVNLWTTSFWINYNKKCIETVTVNLFRVYQSWTKKYIETCGECAKDLRTIRKALKQFLPRLREVCEKDNGSFKALFG